MDFDNIMIWTPPELFSQNICIVQTNFSLSEPFLGVLCNKGLDQKAQEADEKKYVMGNIFGIPKKRNFVEFQKFHNITKCHRYEMCKKLKFLFKMIEEKNEMFHILNILLNIILRRFRHHHSNILASKTPFGSISDSQTPRNFDKILSTD